MEISSENTNRIHSARGPCIEAEEWLGSEGGAFLQLLGGSVSKRTDASPRKMATCCGEDDDEPVDLEVPNFLHPNSTVFIHIPQMFGYPDFFFLLSPRQKTAELRVQKKYPCPLQSHDCQVAQVSHGTGMI